MHQSELSPLYAAQHEQRYRRQELIGEYEDAYACRLIVFIDQFADYNTTLFQELLTDVTDKPDLHVLLNSYGGDGEVAVRLVRAAQSRCDTLTVIVPDVAKSAATLFALGAHRIVMGIDSLDPGEARWQKIWQLWTRYFTIQTRDRAAAIYEGRRISQILTLGQDS